MTGISLKTEPRKIQKNIYIYIKLWDKKSNKEKLLSI